jgi:tetraacyldisaccharide 4'-kinase
LRVPLDEPAWWYRDRPSGIAACLAPLASVYGWAATTRYARTQPYRSRLPVICAGNFTAGGTGKTPLVMHLCERLRTDGHHPVALTRGYGGRHAGPHRVGDADTADDVGDEALLLARAAPTLIARDRGAGARAAEAMPGPVSVIVMDDGLQNPSLAKDLAIAMVDGSRGLGNGLVIPAGPLRAPLDFQLGLADAIIVNGAGAGDHVAEWLRHRFDGPVLRSFTAVAGDVDGLRGRRVVAWAGIASPQRFLATLETQGAAVIEHVFFRDHHRLAQADAERLLAMAHGLQARLVSTEKDLARLKGATRKLAELAAATRVLQIRLSFAEPDAERLTAMIDSALKGHSERVASGE